MDRGALAPGEAATASGHFGGTTMPLDHSHAVLAAFVGSNRSPVVTA